MDLKKKKAFNEKMGKHKKFPNHQNLAKGGMVKHYDGGGMTSGGLLGIPGAFTAQNQYAAGMAPQTQLNYGDVTNQAGQNALGANATTQGIVGSQLGLAGQLQGVANGTGPNPAQAMLAQQTGANVANQGALMAGQRGASQNVGLLAREAANQGAATQQQAVGQAASLQSQQQLNALGAIGQQYQNAANANISQQNANTSLFGTGASANNAQNNSAISNYGMAQGINAQIAQNNSNAVNQTQAGLLGGAAGLVGQPHLFGMAHGGEVRLDNGGLIPAAEMLAEPSAPNINTPVIAGGTLKAPKKDDVPKEKKADTPIADSLQAPQLGSQFSGASSAPSLGAGTLDAAPAASGGAGMLGVDTALPALSPEMAAGAALAHGGAVHPSYHPRYFHDYFATGGMSGPGVDALVSPKEVYLNPRQVKEVAERGADPMKIGHHFGGQDKVKRDSFKNDFIKTKLEDGGIVLPIHVTTHKNASEKGRQFVAKTIAKHMKRPGGAK